MSETLELLVALRKAGANITIKDGKLRCEAPKGVLTKELKEQLKAHKDELIRLLQGKLGIAESTEVGDGPAYPDGRSLVKCFYCLRLEGRICQIDGKSISGIALLRECEFFVMQMVH